MTYQQTLDFLYAQLPMYQRVGQTAFKKNLDNILALCEHLGNPHHQFRSIHIGGTNGKGSSAHILAAILQQGGYKTGLYTSPHLKNFTERIKLNGAEVSRDFVVDFVAKNRLVIEEIKPSFFEMTVAMAFSYFADNQVDIAVIEVGLGGRLDSTNIITPLASLITNISLDHEAMLGETLPEIAFEKAGIIKENVPVVIAKKQSEVASVFQETAQKKQANLYFASEHFDIKIKDDLRLDIFYKNESYLSHVKLPLQGKYQHHNLKGVLQTLEVLPFKIPKRAVRLAIQNMLSLTNLKGRWQVLSEAPLTICDIGHNQDAILQIVTQFSNYKYEKLHIVLGTVNDKALDKMLSLLPTDAVYYFTQAKVPRALAAGKLADEAQKHHLKGEIIPDVRTALKKAQAKASSKDFIFVGGSAFVVAEVV